MNRALLYLWWTLLKRRAFRVGRDLRRPTKLIGLAALAGLFGFLFHYRAHESVGQFVRRETAIGLALVMLGGSVFKGFLRRGLAFDPADIEFLFTGPFTQHQIVVYRLLPNYLFALIEGGVFLALLLPHLTHPLLTTACFILFQIACFHVGTATSLFAGSIPERAHDRIRWMLVAVYFAGTGLYLRVAWDIRLLPSIAAAPVTQLLFYPAITLRDVGLAPINREWLLGLYGSGSTAALLAARPLIWLGGFAASAAASLWILLKLKAHIFETSLATTTRVAERRVRIEQGRRVPVLEQNNLRSARLPQWTLFGGVGAIVWKNLVVARRSKRELVLAFVFTLVFTTPLVAMLWMHHDFLSKGLATSRQEAEEFHTGIALMLGFLAFLLQRTFPFDFRCDGLHLVGFRTLPTSAFALALAEIAVPTGLCLAFQALGIAALMFYAGLGWAMTLVVLLAYPAVALAVNAVWNLQYLLSAARRASGRGQSASAAGTLIVVALSFLIFFPAGWTSAWIFDRNLGFTAAATASLAVQYCVDFLLVWMLARLFQRFEVSRDVP